MYNAQSPICTRTVVVISAVRVHVTGWRCWIYPWNISIGERERRAYHQWGDGRRDPPLRS
jgi:hypothetical protein